MADLSGRVSIITGAASGIGRATAELFAAAGARVALADRDTVGLEEVTQSILKAGGDALAVPTDVAVAEECRQLVEAAVAWAGELHVVVNIAAVGQFDSTIETLEEAEWDRVLAINLKSVYLISKHAVPHLRSTGRHLRGGAVILNVASPHAFATTEGVCAYAASKGGVVALSRQMALDLAKDSIRVVSVVPGAVDTPMLRSHAERQNTTLDALGFHTDPRKIGRIGEPEEMAHALAFLASGDASFINAAPIFVDGGLLARL